jgi:thiamine biosynthesis lipoprotein
MTARVLIPEFIERPRLPKGAVFEQLSGRTMGTTWVVKLFASACVNRQEIHHGIQRKLDRLDAQMSTWKQTSALSLFNAAPFQTWCVLPEEVLTVLECAIRIGRETDGAFDPTVGALVNRWGFGAAARSAAVPSESELADLRACVSWREISLDVPQRAVLQPGGLSLDLSSIAKGFSVDHIAEYLDALEIDSYLVEIGGELRGRGIKTDGTPWWVGLESPPTGNRAHSNPCENWIVALHHFSIATSGNYRRCFQEAGMSYSHIIDPRSGCPTQNDVASVTVLHTSCMQADAYSTALMVLGVDEGLATATRLGLPALLIRRTASGLEEQCTPRLAAMVSTILSPVN